MLPVTSECSACERNSRSLASFTTKAAKAEEHQAAALVVVNDAATSADGDDLLDFNYTALMYSKAGIPVFHVHRSVLESMLPGSAKELNQIEASIDANSSFSFAVGLIWASPIATSLSP